MEEKEKNTRSDFTAMSSPWLDTYALPTLEKDFQPQIKSDFRTMTKERWNNLLELRRRIAAGDTERLNHCEGILPPEIAKSWRESIHLGKRMQDLPRTHGHKRQPRTISNQIRETLEIVVPALKAFEIPRKNHRFIMLHDIAGNLLYGASIAKYQDELKDVQYMPNNLQNNGTTGLVITAALRRPYIMYAPEHFLDYFNVGRTTINVPIFDERGNILLCLTLTVDVDTPWQSQEQETLFEAFSLALLLGQSIEKQLNIQRILHQLASTNEELEAANRLLEITLSTIDDGIITMTENGEITHINKSARKMLYLSPKDRSHPHQRLNIRDFLIEDSHLLDNIKSQEETNYEEKFRTPKDQATYFTSLSFDAASNGKINHIVMRLTPIESINSIVNARSGNTARFSFDDILGSSPVLRKAIEESRWMANLPENILLAGENGTGKEMFAQSIHNASRPHGPFIAINCAALPRELIVSELFGYEAGSFTGADKKGRPGKFELAHKGTLFLDEIGDMPIELQGILLRVLEDHCVTRVGGSSCKEIDCRVISASNRNLQEMVQQKLFREDLYFRLATLTLQVPPLRERDGDAILLSHHFIKRYCQRIGRPIPVISRDALELLRRYVWPGNVRQLENVVIYAVNAMKGHEILVEDLPLGDDSANLLSAEARQRSKSPDINWGTVKNQLDAVQSEKQAIEKALTMTCYNIAKAARVLGISRSTLYRKIAKYDIPTI